MKRDDLETLRLNTVRLAEAALRYCAVADWFEGPECIAMNDIRDATELYNDVERKLREAAKSLMKGYRSAWGLLEAAKRDQGRIGGEDE